MWKYTHPPRFPIAYVEQIERDPTCLVGTTWVWDRGWVDPPFERLIVIRSVEIPRGPLPSAPGAPEATIVRFHKEPVSGFEDFFLSFLMEYCVPWTPSMGPTSWDRLLEDDGL